MQIKFIISYHNNMGKRETCNFGLNVNVKHIIFPKVNPTNSFPLFCISFSFYNINFY